MISIFIKFHHLVYSSCAGTLMLVFFGVNSTKAIAQENASYEAIDTTVQRLMVDKKVPGFAIGIVKDTTLVWSKSYGLADRVRKVQMSDKAIMNIGSISKTFTATAVMQLWEQSRVNLHADVSAYLGF